MKIIPMAMLCLLTFSIQSCKTNKTVAKEEVTKEVKAVVKSSDEFEKEGYVKASVVFYSEKSTPCDYLIKTETGELLEASTFEQKEFKTNNSSVWIKFARQRRLSRCEGAQPINLIDIKKRAN